MTHVDGSTDGIINTYSWPQTGTKTVSITATNLGGTVTATRLITLTDVPITGLVARNSSPTAPGRSTILSATVATGTNIGYAWALGDGQAGSSQTVTHTYPAPGNYRAVVTASNPVSVLTATTYVTVANSDIFLPALVKGYACSPDAYEPNDSADEAYILSDNTSALGQLLRGRHQRRIQGPRWRHGNAYSPQPHAGARRMRLRPVSLPSARRDHPVAQSSASGNASESINYEPTQAGDYLVYVYAAVKGGSAGTSPYQLSVTFE